MKNRQPLRPSLGSNSKAKQWNLGSWFSSGKLELLKVLDRGFRGENFERNPPENRMQLAPLIELIIHRGELKNLERHQRVPKA